MSPENFCYFLQGYLETSNPEFISAAQTQIIKDHLALVFNKVTPDRSGIEIFASKTPSSGRTYDENGQPLKVWPVFDPNAKTSLSDFDYPDTLKNWNKNNPTNPRIC